MERQAWSVFVYGVFVFLVLLGRAVTIVSARGNTRPWVFTEFVYEGKYGEEEAY